MIKQVMRNYFEIYCQLLCIPPPEYSQEYSLRELEAECSEVEDF